MNKDYSIEELREKVLKITEVDKEFR